MLWKQILSFVVLALPLCGTARAAESSATESIEAIESAQLGLYLAELQAGQPGRAASVEQLADISFAGLRQIAEAYAALEEPIEPATHRAFQALLERTSRTALVPWTLITMYSGDLAQFLVAPASENPLADRLFDRLIGSGTDRRAFDLAVRLTPGPALQYLAGGKTAARQTLLEAWNRRLARGAERRPIAALDQLVGEICRSLRPSVPTVGQEASLQFLGSWPTERNAYIAAMQTCLDSDDEHVVLAALAVQQRIPAALELNPAVIKRFAERAPVVEAALKNYAFDASQDHSVELRKLWADLKSDQERARYNCLFSMGAHPQGNESIALAAVLDRPYAFVDVAMPVLQHGDPALVRQAVAHVLANSKRGCEEALRLARSMKLEGFEQQAVQIATDKNRDQILRQAALLYLQLADGKWRRQLMPMLASANADLRLTAIQMFMPVAGLSQPDRDEIGPALIRVAFDDASMGHRQEAIYVLGNWREPNAAKFFRTILAAHPPVPAGEQHQGDARYWDYRLRLVALLGLARLDDRSARDELIELHRQGGPVERMDVLLAFRDLLAGGKSGEVPAEAWEDLDSTEPKLVATAAQLIAAHADAAARERLQQYFRRSPLWLEFQGSGLDDHNILEAAGLEEHDAAH